MHLSQNGDTAAYSSGLTFLARLAFDMKHLGKPRSELRKASSVLCVAPWTATWICRGRGLADASKAVALDILSNIGETLGDWDLENWDRERQQEKQREGKREREREKERERERKRDGVAFADRASFWSTQ